MSSSSNLNLSFAPLDYRVEYYSDWSVRMKVLLRSLDCVEVLNDEDPTVIRSLTAKQIQEKSQKDAKAMEAIFRHLSAYALNIVRDKRNAKEVWIALKTTYEDRSPANQLHLFDKLLQLKMNSEDILVHFTTFDKIINELRCSGALAINDEQFLSCILLRSMNAEYKHAVTAIAMTSKDNLKIENVKANLRTYSLSLNKNTNTVKANEEMVMMVSDGSLQPNQIFRGSYNGRARFGLGCGGRTRNSYFCKFCKKLGHLERECRFKTSIRGRGGKIRNSYFCIHCKKSGHLEKECRFKRRQVQPQVDESKQNEKVNAMVTGSDDFGFIGMVCDTTYSGNTYDDTLMFYLDSGSVEHIINVPNILTGSISNLTPPLKLGLADKNAKNLEAYQKGDLAIITDLGIRGILTNVLYAPNVRFNLLSVLKLQKNGVVVVFNNFKVHLYYNNKLIASGESMNGSLFKIKVRLLNNPRQCLNVDKTCANITELWHKRMGHLSIPNLRILFMKNMVLGANNKIASTIELCETCVLSSQTRKPLNNKKDIKIGPLDIVYSDVCGPIHPTSRHCEKYFVTFIEGYTHFTYVYLLKQKSDVYQVFKEFETRIVLLLNGRGIKFLYCDNGGEYVSNEMKEFCKEKGIELHYTIRHTPSLNGVAERMNRTLIEKVRALIIDSGMPKNFWGYALKNRYILNKQKSNTCFK